MKLTNQQTNAMIWLSYGWNSEPHDGEYVVINGHPRCTTQNIQQLRSMGMVELNNDRCWMATDKGKEFMEALYA